MFNHFSLGQRRVRFFFVLALIVAIVTVIEVWAVNRLSTYGEELSRIENTISKFDLENRILENEIAARSSIYKLEKITTNLGFEHASTIEYLKK